MLAEAVDDRRPALPALFAPTPKAARRVLEFFTAQINNDHTRAAYMNAARRFAQWCETKGLPELAEVQPFHVAAFIKESRGQFAPPTVKQHLAALRMLFDRLVSGHVLDTNPAHAVRGPRYVVTKGKTPVLAADEARALLDSIPVRRKVLLEDGAEIEQPLLVGLRDRAVMAFTRAKVETITPMSRSAQEFTRNPLWQQDAYRMIQRRAKAAGIETRIGNHSFRATGITAYLKNEGLLEHAQQIAAHASPRTTRLYDRRVDDITPGEVEKIRI
jgi:site-specific recombinase XerD